VSLEVSRNVRQPAAPVDMTVTTGLYDARLRLDEPPVATGSTCVSRVDFRTLNLGPASKPVAGARRVLASYFTEETMKKFVAAVCFILAAVPVALAQDKSKDVEKKAPMAAEKSTKGDATKSKGDEKKSATASDKSAKSGDTKKEPTAKQKAQQERMKDCSTRAGDRKGDDRKKFMSSCLKGEDVGKKAAKATDKKTGQQDKMRSCSKEASEKKMKGDDRKAFMKDCLAK